VKLNYKWSLLLNGVALSLSSTSRFVSQYQLPPYSLTAENVYSLVLNVSIVESGSVVSFSYATQTIIVSSGLLYGIVSGGATRQISLDRNITISTSSSYDENSPYSTLLYSWACATTSFDNYGENCTNIFEHANSSSPWITVFGYTLNATDTYKLTLTVTTNPSDGRVGFADISIIPNGVGTPLTEILTTSRVLNYNLNFSILSYVQSETYTYSYWTILIDGVNQTVGLNSPSERSIAASYASAGVPLALVMQQFTFTPGSSVTFRVYAQSITTTDRRRLAETSTSYSDITVLINGPPTVSNIF
jgi:hypothetical protein